MWTWLIPFKKDLVYVGILAVLCGIFIWYRHSLIAEGESRIEAQDKTIVAQRVADIAKQKAEDEKVLKDAQDVHQAELQAVQTASLEPVPVVRLCHETGPSPLPPTKNVSSDTSSAAAVVPADDGLHPPGPDIGTALRMLATRGDKLSADARELQSVAH